MLETLWQKIRKNHFLLMALCCLVSVVLVIGFFSFFKGNGYWVWLIILLCPILHFWMIRGHKHSEASKLLYKCPECGFDYEEKEWAEKCEAWCKEHHTCNLEITKHAVKNKVGEVISRI